jgi:hypothetical protein
MNNMRISPTSQGFIMIMLTVVAIAIVTALSLLLLQQIIGIFYASTVDAILITAIIVGSNRVVHKRLAKVQ